MSQDTMNVDDLVSDEEIRDLSALGRSHEQLTLEKQRLREARIALELAFQKEDADKALIRLRLGDIRNKIEKVNRKRELLVETIDVTQAPSEEEVKGMRDAVRALRKKVAEARTWTELFTLAVGALEDALPRAGGAAAGANG